MKSRFLLLWLEAPLQSWGVDSKFGRRDSLDFPTKSGIAGLLLCALGASGEQEDLLAELAPLGQTVLAFLPERNGRNVEPQAFLRDFNMVGSGYKEDEAWETLNIPKTSDGKKAVGGGTKMTYRYFLQDRSFAAIVEVPGNRAEEFAGALVNPVYDIYLGRKCCVPTDMVYRGNYEQEEDAIAAALAIGAEKGLSENYRAVDGDNGDEVLTLNDVPLQFGEAKKYRERRVSLQRHE